MRNNKVILFISPCVNEMVLHRFQRLKGCIPANFDLFWIIYDEEDKSLAHSEHMFFLDADDLNDLGYNAINENIWYGSVNFITQYFRREYNNYDYYWNILCNVEFTGNWSILFLSYECDETDFIATHVEAYSESNSKWKIWNNVNFKEFFIRKESMLRCMSPVFRISGRALDFLDVFFKEGNWGHSDVLIPTALYHNGFEIEDFGGIGRFVPPGCRNNFYIGGADINSGTVRNSPYFLYSEVEALQIRNKLFYPLKLNIL